MCLVTEALANEIRHRERLAQFDQLRQFQDYMRSKYGELPSSAKEIAAIRTERDAILGNLQADYPTISE